MKITRRKFIFYGVLGLSTTSLYSRASNTADLDWKITCRNWMTVLLPSDKYGPGADTPIVWELLEQLMENNKRTRQWMILGLNRLGKQNVPKSKEELLKMQKTGRPYSTFIKFLNKIFVEYYYASPQGWKELGMLSPPQPKGFAL